MSLTSASVLRQLRISNCCAARKWEKYVEGLRCGQRYDDQKYEAKTMVNLIDALRGFVPSGELLSGTHASVTFEIDGALAAVTGTVTITITDPSDASIVATYSLSYIGTTADDLANQVIAYINSFYPENYAYTAAEGDNPEDVVIEATDFDGSNDFEVSFNKATDTDKVMAGGVAAVYQIEADNCITNAEAESIIERLDKLCNCDCSKVVDFSEDEDDDTGLWDETGVYRLVGENNEFLIEES